MLKVGQSRFSGLTRLEGVVPGVKPSKDIPLPEHIANWRSVLQQLAAHFHNGKAIVDPKSPHDTCKYCSLPALCRIGSADRRDDAELEGARA